MKHLLILALLLSGCSARWHFNQAKKKGLTLDTLTVTDTITIQDIAKDTSIQVIYDSIQVIRFKDSAKVRLQWITRHINDTIKHIDSVKVEVDCPDNKVITNEKTVHITTPLSWWDRFKYYFSPFLLLILIILGGLRIKR